MYVELEVLCSLIFLVLLVWLFYGPWQEICADTARQKIFEARDNVFDLAAEGHLDFSEDTYLVIREHFQILIRFAHSTSWVRGILFSMLVDKDRKSVSKKNVVFDALDRINDAKLREEVRAEVSSAHKAILRLMVERSVILLFLFIGIYIFYKSSSFVKNMLSPLVRMTMEVLLRDAEKYDEYDTTLRLKHELEPAKP